MTTAIKAGLAAVALAIALAVAAAACGKDVPLGVAPPLDGGADAGDAGGAGDAGD